MKEFIKSNWAWIGIIIVLICALVSRCNNDKITKHDTVEYKTVTTKKEAIEAVKLPETIVKKFTEIKTITKYVDRIKIDTIAVRYKDSVPYVFERIGEIKTDEYEFTYKSNNKGLKVSDLTINDSLIIVTGNKRKWLLGEKINTIDISHSNKYVNSKEIQHIEVAPKKEFYDTTLFKFGLGFILGVAIIK